VLAGLFDALKKANPKNKLIGFLGGPSGILENKWVEITAPLVDRYRNTGGFDMIQSGRTKIETPEQFTAAKQTLETNRLGRPRRGGGGRFKHQRRALGGIF
jgi:pyrophosphate--fructose-6-phosphate 1-phosphotransferase